MLCTSIVLSQNIEHCTLYIAPYIAPMNYSWRNDRIRTVQPHKVEDGERLYVRMKQPKQQPQAAPADGEYCHTSLRRQSRIGRCSVILSE